jgi:UDP-N-acetylmuramoylalanine--D-glutamate ligase
MPDHLNRYATIQEYVESKKSIFRYQDKNDYLVLNNNDPIVRQMVKEARGNVIYFSAENPLESNKAAAVRVAEILQIPEKNIKKAIKNFKGVHSRQELVREINGVRYINDTTATIPEAVILALDTFKNIVLICGGVYKGVEYKQMAEKIKEKVKAIVLLPGSGSDKLKESLSNYKNITNVTSMHEAVNVASKIANPGDVVILSPAASSFNLFKNEFDRGDQFVKAVKNLK